MTMQSTKGATDRALSNAAVVEGTGLSPATSLFHSLSDPARLAILRHLILDEHRVVDLTAHLGLAQSTVSKHLACLRDCRLVKSRPHGRASMFSLAVGDELFDLLAAAERLLAATGDAVDLCPNYGTNTGTDAAAAKTATSTTSGTAREVAP
jgi:DNA-binding transcriptional ArsR family regulator